MNKIVSLSPNRQDPLDANIARMLEAIAEENHALALIREVRKKGLGRIAPTPSLEAPNGYFYPVAAEFYGVRDGSEVHRLKALANVGRLEKEIFDTFCVCMNCRDFRVRAWEECRSCLGAHLRRVELIHHYRCAWTAAETEFLKGHDYICPKCRRLLVMVGVDYDRPGRFYLCSACARKNPEDGVSAGCESCRRTFAADDLPTQMVYTYILKPEEAVVQSGGAE